MPVLMVHGTSDGVIPLRHSERLFDLAKEPKVLRRIAGGDHNTLVRDGLYAHVFEFLGSLAGRGTARPRN